MRHRVAKPKLSRDMGHRKALLKNMSASLIEHGKIETTLAKAKSLRPYVEKLVTKAKNGAEYNTLRYLRGRLFSEDAIRKLVEEIGPEFKSRNGGYTRIVRTRNRDGDNSIMARIEFVRSKEAAKSKPKTDKKSTDKAETKEPEKTKETKQSAEKKATAKEKAATKTKAKKVEKKETKKND